MGAVLESRAPGWSYEVRGESWYLSADGWNEYRHGGAEPPAVGLRASEHGALVIPAEQVPNLIAAVEHVIEHTGQVPKPGGNEAHEPLEWGAVVLDGRRDVLINGPVITFGVGEPVELCGAVEFEYRHTRSLLAALNRLWWGELIDLRG